MTSVDVCAQPRRALVGVVAPGRGARESLPPSMTCNTLRSPRLSERGTEEMPLELDGPARRACSQAADKVPSGAARLRVRGAEVRVQRRELSVGNEPTRSSRLLE